MRYQEGLHQPVDLLRVQMRSQQSQKELAMLQQLLPLNDDLSSIYIPFEGVEHVAKPALAVGSTRW